MRFLNLYRCVITFIFLLLATPVSAMDPFNHLNSLILSDDIIGAKTELKKLYVTRGVGDTEWVKSLYDYEKIIDVLDALDRFKNNSIIFKKTKMEQPDFLPIESSYGLFSLSWGGITKLSLRIDCQEIITKINTEHQEAITEYDVIKQLYADANERRKRELDEKKASCEAQQKAETERLESERRSEEKKAESQKKATQAAFTNRLNKLDNIAITKGYVGLNKKFGIARFLYFSSKNGNLEDGLKQIFWSGLSEKDSNMDKKFKLTQVVDGFEIYELHEWAGSSNGWVSLAIAVPAGRMPMEGQRLKHDFYVFDGNLQFDTVNGTTRIVQKFSPVDLGRL